jgi:hypothetical protein
MISQPHRCTRQYRAVAAALQRGVRYSSLRYLTPAEHKGKHLAAMDGWRSPAMQARADQEERSARVCVAA